MSSFTFRNVDIDVSDPVETWPIEAVQAALARGGLGIWRRIVAAIRPDPWGSVARSVESVLAYDRPYGVAELMENAIARAREETEAAERAEIAAELRELVERSGLNRAEFASRLGTSRSRLSTYLSGKVIPSATLMVRARGIAGGGSGSR